MGESRLSEMNSRLRILAKRRRESAGCWLVGNETRREPRHTFLLQATSYKLQVTSYKLQVTQVTSYKLQATSYKLREPRHTRSSERRRSFTASSVRPEEAHLLISR